MGKYFCLPSIYDHNVAILLVDQQAMHRGTHDAHFPIFRFRENREIACWWQRPQSPDRTINCAAARPADASGNMDSSTLPMLFSFLRFALVGAKQMIHIGLDGQQLFHLIAGPAIVGVSLLFL